MLPFEYAVENGFDAFEWFPDKKENAGWDEGDMDAKTRDYIRKKALEHDIELSVHSSWHVNPLRPESHEPLFKDLEFARDIGAVLFNLHFFIDEGTEAFLEAITRLIIRLAEAGMRLSVENTPLTGPEHFNNLFSSLLNLKSVTTEHVGMCLDIGHANLCESTRNDYLKFIDRLDARVQIIHVHLHENYGDHDSHLPIFTGPAEGEHAGMREFINRLQVRGFSGSIILEQWPVPPSLLNKARDKLYRMISDSRIGTDSYQNPEF
jgi:sugar phosphate isomerase/epimerase